MSPQGLCLSPRKPPFNFVGRRRPSNPPGEGFRPRVKEDRMTAAEFLPEKLTLSTLREAAAGCRGCPLWENATQTVFGEGRRDTQVMLVGEQPGDQEDLAGKPFVGPAGRMLDRALEEAGIDRSL